jgi:hypothetical protein
MASRYTHIHIIRSCGNKYAYRWPVSLDENVTRLNPSAPCMSVCIVQNSPDWYLSSAKGIRRAVEVWRNFAPPNWGVLYFMRCPRVLFSKFFKYTLSWFERWYLV